MSLNHYQIGKELIAATDLESALKEFMSRPQFQIVKQVLESEVTAKILIEPISGREYHLRLREAKEVGK